MAATATFLQSNITQLHLSSGSELLNRATGFYLKFGVSWFLVTNWHVLAGCRTDTGLPQNRNGLTPDAVVFSSYCVVADKLARVERSLPLRMPGDGQATWFEHPTLGRNVDVGVLYLGHEKPGLAKDILDPEGYDASMWVDLGGEVFLPGYPLGLTGPVGTSIWKRASLATSTEFGEGIARYVLVDTATRSGMSGSPCFAVCNWQYYSLAQDGSGRMTIKQRPVTVKLLGVYSGRLNASDDLQAQLGIVWRENLIFETCAGAKLADTRPPE